jgi:hypothetical protein
MAEPTTFRYVRVRPAQYSKKLYCEFNDWAGSGMAHNVSCYRCGASLAEFSLPLSRQDECPGCGNYVHVCMMCTNFDKSVPKQCREDDAEEVIEKARLNFCDWFVASETAFDPTSKASEDRAKEALGALFGGETEQSADVDRSLSDAERLFK